VFLVVNLWVGFKKTLNHKIVYLNVGFYQSTHVMELVLVHVQKFPFLNHIMKQTFMDFQNV